MTLILEPSLASGGFALIAMPKSLDMLQRVADTTASAGAAQRLRLEVLEGGAAADAAGLEATMSSQVAQRLALINLLGSAGSKRRGRPTRAKRQPGREQTELLRQVRCRP